MIRHVVAGALFAALALSEPGLPAIARAQQNSGAGPTEAPEEAGERKVMERFLSLLEKRPRVGTALERVYGYHVERGTLNQLTRTYQARIADDERDGIAWMLLGMIESQRGRDAEAVKAFRGAEKHLPDEPLASYYLGKSLVLVGRPEEAVTAFERAIARKPQRTDLLEIFQALGRVYQRARRHAEALKVWDRLEELFPDDLRVQEEIATILADEGDHEGALKRFEDLAGKSDDRYRQVQYGIQVGELKVRLGRVTEAIAGFEKLIGQLKPGSWLHRDVRGRIENVFLRSDDYAGLAKYYETWIEKNPEDVDAMSRVGRALAMQGRLPEAQRWYRKAIELAPSDSRLRRSLIEQLVGEGKFGEAIAEYEALDEIDPNNPDNIQQWGRLILADKTRPEPDRKRLAADVWNRLVEAKPDDPVIATQVADLFRHANMTDEAIALYEKAVGLVPDAVQYREYLGEYYHVLQRPEDAKRVWRQIASGKNRNRQNLVRLAEVFAGFGYEPEALAVMSEACSMDPEFDERVRFARMLCDGGKTTESLEQLELGADRVGKRPQPGPIDCLHVLTSFRTG